MTRLTRNGIGNVVTTGRSHRRRTVRELVVLLGDPRLADPVKRNGRFNEEDFEALARLKDALQRLNQYKYVFLDNHATILEDLRNHQGSFVLNFCDEGFYNAASLELHVPALLDFLNVPYSGAGPACLSLSYDKVASTGVVQSLGIPVPQSIYLAPTDSIPDVSALLPAFIKLNCSDGSFGIGAEALVQSQAEAIALVRRLRRKHAGQGIIIQEFLSGTEYTASVVGNPGQGFRVFPFLQMDYSGLPADRPPIFTYEAKWDVESPVFSAVKYYSATDLNDLEKRQLADHCCRIFERLGCRDYARLDFRRDADGVIKFLEANPNPGWYWDSFFNLMGECDGLAYHELLDLVIRAALARYDLTERNVAATAK